MQTLPGRLPRSLASVMPSAIATARSMAASAADASERSATWKTTFLSARFCFGGSLFSLSKRYMPSMTASTACSIFHAPSRPFTGSSLRQSVASAAPVVRSVFVAAHERRVIAALDEFALGAQADEKHALGGRVRNPGQE